MRGSIGVRVDDGLNDRTVTAQVSGLKFSSCSDGGHKAASFTVTVARGTFTDLGPSDKCYLYDTRTGSALWEGYLDAPTPTIGPFGERYEVSALGGMVRATDETRPLLYADRSLGGYERDPSAVANASVDSGTDEFYSTKLRVRTLLGGGSVVDTGTTAAATNSALVQSDMFLGGISVSNFYSGRADSGYAEDFAVPAGVVYTRTMNNVAASLTYFVGAAGGAPIVNSGAIPAGNKVFGLRVRRTGAATNVADDTTWTNWVEVCIIGQRMTRTGVLLTGSTGLRSAQNVLASEVVEDLLGRLLGFCDPSVSTVASTTHAIDQLAYPDGATAGRVLDDLSDYEPDMLWEILHSTSQGHVFNYRPWPTMPRYEISTRDGYAESGSDADLCNRVVVTWADAAGDSQTTIVTATSTQYPALQALEAVGRIRDADPISLPEGLGSLANAQAVGAAILADSAGQNTSARASISRPLRDLYTGSMVMPWEIQAGYLVQVRELGKVLRLTEQEYTDADCSASLTLGYPSLTRDQRIAALSRA